MNRDTDKELASARRRAALRDRRAAGTFEGHVTYRGVDIGSRDQLLIDIVPVRVLLDYLDRFTLNAVAGVLVDGEGPGYIMLLHPRCYNDVVVGAVRAAVTKACLDGVFPAFDNFTILADDGRSRTDFGCPVD